MKKNLEKLSKFLPEKFSRKKIKNLFTWKNAFRMVVFALFIIILIQMQSIVGTFSFLQGRDTSLITEIGQIKESYLKIGNDLNEVREFLRMPTEKYKGFEEPADEAAENSIKLSLFKYVDSMITDKNLEENLTQNRTYLEKLVISKKFLDFLAGQALKIGTIEETDDGYSLKIFGPDEEELFVYYLGKNNGILYLKTAKEKGKITVKNYEEFETNMIAYVGENKDGLLVATKNLETKILEIVAAINSPETAAATEKLKITISKEFSEQDLKIIHSIFNRDGEIIGEIQLNTDNLEIYLTDKNDNSLSLQVTDISTALIPFLQKLNTKTYLEKKAEASLKELNKTVTDSAFQKLLSQNNLSLNTEPREDTDRLYYDIFVGDVHVSSIVAEKATGIIYIADPDGTNFENLLFYSPESKKKTIAIPDVIPEYGDTVLNGENTFNILVAGKNGSLLDSMIFAHINEDKQTVRMVSIPRDLFYNGRKINSYAFYYGLPELKKVISDVTGYKLDKYIVIDMYAFIEVVDLVGGIDVHLDTPVIDPTYRVVENGVEGTLHYDPGDYHFGGVEALRIARSRYTTSDFSRAARQQIILKALQTKSKDLGFGDADTIYEIAKSVLAKTETDISLDEAVAYYFRYRNYKIETADVMSSGNILYVPPYITEKACEELIAAAAAAGTEKPGCEEENHAYTLLPKNDNWNIIKWFFREKFEAI